MKYIESFKIPFKGLEIGQHEFEFNISNKFFDLYKDSNLELSSGELKCVAMLDKKNNLLTLDVVINGYVDAVCDRCLDSFQLPIESTSTIYIKIGGNIDEQNDELIVLSEDDSEFNIADYLYECICLELPIRKVHDELTTSKTKCNKEMLKKIKELSTKNEVKNVNETDARWDKLKNININN